MARRSVKRRNASEYEFPKDVKKALRAQAGGICEECQRSTDALKIHHKHVYASEGIDYNLPASLISNKHNAACLCAECHDKAHENDEQRDEEAILTGLSLITQAMNFRYKPELKRR